MTSGFQTHEPRNDTNSSKGRYAANNTNLLEAETQLRERVVLLMHKCETSY